MRLAEQVAIVTGAAGAIGRAIATRLAREGAHVAIADVNQEGANDTSRAVKAEGGRSLVVRTDVSKSAEVDRLIELTMENFARIDILINNAGIWQGVPPGLPVAAINEEDWDRMMAVNLKSVFLCSQAVTRIMKAQRSGNVVNIASLSGKLGGVVSGANYAVSKAGVICLTKCLARECAPYGIRVNAIAPGQIDTPMTEVVFQYRSREDIEASIPLGRLGHPEDIAKAVVFLTSDEAAYLTGEILDVNGGSFMD
jgi:3-oxoacyl-[acyl-carrier protein] reductase